MGEAFIIDACRTPRGIGKVGKGSLAHIHPQELGAAVLRALKERNDLNTADVDHIIVLIEGPTHPLRPVVGFAHRGGDRRRFKALVALEHRFG